MKSRTMRRNFCKQQAGSLEHFFWTCNVVQHFWLTFKQIVYEKCLNMVNIKLNEEIVLFGNAKDFKSDANFDFVILFANLYLYNCKIGNIHPLVHVFLKQLATRFKTEEYLSYVNMEHASLLTKWFCYIIMPSIPSVQNNGWICVYCP